MKTQESKRVVDRAEVGQVHFVKTKRARRVKILLRPFKPIRVSVPYRVSYDEAMRFFESHFDWVVKTNLKMKCFEAEQTKNCEKLEPVDRTWARSFLKQRLDFLAERFGFEYGRLAVRNQKSRWGSCSYKNNINLNVNLLRLPAELVDYVILHELVHTRVKNHGPLFWGMLEKMMPGAKEFDKQLKQYYLPMLQSKDAIGAN